MLRGSSITPTPQVVTIDSLNQALYPSTINDIQEKSDSATAGNAITKDELNPMELISFLSSLDTLFISHNGKKEFCTCPWRTVLDIKTPDGKVVIEAMKKIEYMTCYKENIEVFNTSTNEVVILIEFLGGGCFSVPTRVQVYGPTGHSIGFIEKSAQQCCSWTPDSYEILSNTEESIYTLLTLPLKFCLSQFQVKSKDGGQVVAEIISKGYGWTLKFKENLTPFNRALIIGLVLYLESVESMKKGTII